jgi:hypothetical protein
MDQLRLELNRAANDPNDQNARRLALRAEKENCRAKIAAVETEENLMEAGRWNGPTTPLSPTAIYVAPAPVTTGTGPTKPRFNPVDLPPILFGQDLEEWISHMDHMVSSFGELVVCPHILHRCFAVGDPMRDWYLTKPSEIHTFVTTGDGCWDRFKTLLRGRFKPDVGVMQYEADSYRKMPGDSWAAFGIRKYRLLKRAYEGAEEANIILKIKAAMDTDVVRYCKEKNNIDTFIGELMDYDRTTPVTTHSPGRLFPPANFTPVEHSPKSAGRSYGYRAEEAAQYTPRPQKAKAVDRGDHDRKATIQNRANPETGKLVRSYLNFQGKPVFIKHACKICEKNGKSGQMHFSFECPNNANPRTHAGEAEDPDDMLENQLYRTESGNLTSYNFQHPNVAHTTTLYHEDDDCYDSESGNGFGNQ